MKGIESSWKDVSRSAALTCSSGRLSGYDCTFEWTGNGVERMLSKVGGQVLRHKSKNDC